MKKSRRTLLVSAAAPVTRLKTIGGVLSRQHARLDAINALGVIPPDDTKPAYNAALNTIKTEAEAIIAVATELEAR